ncbi:SPASM domain-containing protein [Duganella sp. BJB488]|nr:SPASM domain-containing protein [Duganella sp. BJB475]RFP13129.1 SPASM domain-containing protein [Duganella sp. BJB489]RFP17107.1 SPASM domain-containing protein [Duganella sp. BJB488]RFP25276.1 SPASM domain-containing protein [Duganella sp. BJB476]RFP31674.1 SPASM domain-containing protein [Duganella sp. BJB480]
MVAALHAITHQGEATSGTTASHFVRFLRIYVEMRELVELASLTAEHWNAALRELQRGTHWPYPCGAGYFGVSAVGDLSACHRFVGDEQGAMGSLDGGGDRARQAIWLNERHVHRQQPCSACWARYLCGGGCHHEVLARGRSACDYIRGWLHYTIGAHQRLSQLAPDWYAAPTGKPD